VPKALVEIGGRPILWHVIGIYAAQGFDSFLLATGYLGESIEEFVGAQEWPSRVSVECVDTGLDTPTGGRIARLADRLEGKRFCATYADGVADIDLAALLADHSDHWVNGGFFCLEPAVFDYLDEDSVLEREPLQRLAAEGQLHAHRHEGFWDCMDTYKDAVVLNDLWASGGPPWTAWAEAGAPR
jgi:glucose-1-phosphate cytidylyltransferase